MEYTGITNIGLVRNKNEDTFLMDPARGLFVVCDGMGGHKAGDVASLIAIDTVHRNLEVGYLEKTLSSLKNAFYLANKAIWERGRQIPDFSEMGTTITAAVIVEGKLIIGHVGDSRLYLYREKKLQKLTRDHTLAEKLGQVQEGLQGKAYNNKYNHILTRALGIKNHIEVDYSVNTLYHGDMILLCTDGLYDLLPEHEMELVLFDIRDLDVGAKTLLDLALKKGGLDNITLILIRL